MSKKKSGPGKDKETGSGEKPSQVQIEEERGKSKGMRCGERTKDRNCVCTEELPTWGICDLNDNKNVSVKRKSARCGRLAADSARETGSPVFFPCPLAKCAQGRRPEALPSPVYRRLVVRVESPGEGAR